MPRDTVGVGMCEGAVRAHRVPVPGFTDRVRRMVRRRHPDPAVPYDVWHGWTPVTGFQHNDLLYEWGAIVGSLLMRRGPEYGISGMYIEFENVGSPGDPVDVPSFTREFDQGVEYYNALADSADRDYIRAPLVSALMDSSDAAKYPRGNRLTCFAQTSGVVGVHGKPFAAGNNSVCFGGALVSFLDIADPTRDLVFSRFYLEVANQQAKLDTSQVGFEWKVTFK